MKFAIYISGQILRTVTCNADDIASQLNSGELHISMEEGDDSTHYIVNGVLTQFPLRPGNHHTFDFASDSWIDLRSLQDLKNIANSYINASRLVANASGFEHLGKTFSTDHLSRGDIDGTNGYVSLFGALPKDWAGSWKAADNNYLPIPDLDAWKAFYSSMVATGNVNFSKSQALKAQLAEAKTPEEVEAIIW